MNQAMTEKLVCSADHPYSTAGSPRGARWEHPDAEEILCDGGYPLGVVTYLCPCCGLLFQVELPQ